MPPPAGATKLTFSGTFKGGLEAWAFSLWFTGYSATDVATLPANLEASSTIYAAWRLAFTTPLTSNDAYTRLDAYYYDGGSSAVAHGTASFNYSGSGGSTGFLPLQVACVLTLRTANLTRSGRGRIYCPVPAFALGTEYPFLPLTKVNALCDALGTWLTAQKAVGPVGVVVSQTQGVARPIIAVDADVTPDTQRRRRNKLRSARHTKVV